MKKIRIALIGCGAISQQWHLPILAGHEKVTLTAVVDNSEALLLETQQAFNVPHGFTDLSNIDTTIADAAIIATPGALHASMTNQLLAKGLHILVEKPIALNFKDAEQMVAMAEKQQKVLSVSLYRRLYPSVTTLKQLTHNQTWGKPLSFTFNWGDFYSWGAVSLGNMRKDLAGGGVLMDLGPHALDWLTHIFGDDLALNKYEDDSLGGIDADCRLSLTANCDGSAVPGTLNLSRIRKIGGELSITFEHATVELSVGERYDVTVHPNNAEVAYKCRGRGIEEQDWFDTFRAEIDDFVDAIIEGNEPQLSGKSVLPAAKIIDDCYANASLLQRSWSDLHSIENLSLPQKTVLITGASGFIGGRITEYLSQQFGINVKALVNNPNNASRISRLPVELIQVDLKDREQVNAATQGVDAVIHCAVGTAYGQDDEIYKVTVDGTQNLLDASMENGVKRFIHMSSIAVMDMNVSGEVDELNGAVTHAQDIYSVTKLEAEKRVINSAIKGLETLIFRPTTVYGPYAPLFRVGAGKQLIDGALCIEESSKNAPSNSVYVDNVAAATVYGLAAPADKCTGSIYILNDNDGLTYQGFYEGLGDQIQKTVSYVPAKPAAVAINDNVLKRIATESKKIVKSKQLKQLLKLVYQSETLGYLPRKLVESSPSLEKKLTNSEPFIYIKNTQSGPSEGIDASTQASILSSAIEKELGYKPLVTRDDALRLSADWIKDALMGGAN